jgi:Spy/CpxP family protein refolding chaperone
MITVAAAAALVGAASLASTPAPAAEMGVAAIAPPSLLRPVQFYGGGPHWGDDGWERRRQWREWRQQQDEMRVAEAARREAWRIEQEREQRRAWRRAMREQHGHGYGPNPAYGFGHFRSW